jgi:hypothetical protein
MAARRTGGHDRRPFVHDPEVRMAARRAKVNSKARTSPPWRKAQRQDSRMLRPKDVGDMEAAETISRRLERLGCDPIAIMAEIAGDPGADLRLRLAAAKELAAYQMSKPKGPAVPSAPAIDVGGIIARGWPDHDGVADKGEDGSGPETDTNETEDIAE